MKPRRIDRTRLLYALNAHRAPGPTGVFVLTDNYSVCSVRFFRWEGWPANDDDRRGRRTDLDAYYQRMAQGGGSRKCREPTF